MILNSLSDKELVKGYSTINSHSTVDFLLHHYSVPI